MSAYRDPGSHPEAGNGFEAIIGWMARHGGTCFVPDLRAALPIPREALEAALAQMSADGRIVLRHNFCADEHFAADDLRTVALVDPEADDETGLAAAAASCERLWQRWMATFLASHRCT